MEVTTTFKRMLRFAHLQGAEDRRQLYYGGGYYGYGYGDTTNCEYEDCSVAGIIVGVIIGCCFFSVLVGYMMRTGCGKLCNLCSCDRPARGNRERERDRCEPEAPIENYPKEQLQMASSVPVASGTIVTAQALPAAQAVFAQPVGQANMAYAQQPVAYPGAQPAYPGAQPAYPAQAEPVGQANMAYAQAEPVGQANMAYAQAY